MLKVKINKYRNCALRNLKFSSKSNKGNLVQYSKYNIKETWREFWAPRRETNNLGNSM